MCVTEVMQKKFYLIAFEIFAQLEDSAVRNQPKYMPREIGLVEWSMEKGITKFLHRFIATGKTIVTDAVT